jgi:hypothetical protein
MSSVFVHNVPVPTPLNSHKFPGALKPTAVVAIGSKKITSCSDQVTDLKDIDSRADMRLSLQRPSPVPGAALVLDDYF